MIDNLTIKRVKDAANVVDVIGDFYHLQRDGAAGFTCLCPFHTDKHIGSFKVSETKNIFTCYSCGAKGGPVDFIMKHEGLSFIQAIKWLGAKYGIEVEGASEYKEKVKACKPHAAVPPLPTLTMPVDWVKARMAFAEYNTLVRWINSLNWADDQKKRIPIMLKNYQIGHSPQEGHTIFWLIDEMGNVRTGKMMLYKQDGHRDKESAHNFDFIHSVMYRAKRLDPMEAEARLCYFGQHLVNLCPTATINVVESEKTALICSIYFGHMKENLWIASGGLQNLTRKKLEPLINAGRVICLYPDHDGIEKWEEAKRQIDYRNLRMNRDFMQRYWKPEDGDKADIADIIVGRLQRPGGGIEILRKINPLIDELIKEFDLVEVKKYGLE